MVAMEDLYSVVSARSVLTPLAGTTVPPDLPSLLLHRRAAQGDTVRLYAVGDIGLSGRVNLTGKREGFSYLFHDIAPLLRNGDIVFGNLEGTLTSNVPERALFVGPPNGARAIFDAGFTLLSVANNHIYDYGATGLSSTIAAIEHCGITPLGAGNSSVFARALVRTDKGELRIGWLGCGRTLQKQDSVGPCFWEFNKEELLAAIRQNRKAVDVLIISIHIGNMYLDYPHPAHKAMSEELASEGADLVLMHNAHVLQGVEVMNDRNVVCYNMGNFLFDWQQGYLQNDIMLKEQREGAVFLFDLDVNGISLAAALPTWIDDTCCVRWAVGERGRNILDRLARVSEDLRDDYAPAFWSQYSERNIRAILSMLWFHSRNGNLSVLKQLANQYSWYHVNIVMHSIFAKLRKPFRNLFRVR
jgi:Bacterial capsule synthesis protein PGA_cap